MRLKDYRNLDTEHLMVIGPDNPDPISYWDIPDWYPELNVEKIENGIIYLTNS